MSREWEPGDVVVARHPLKFEDVRGIIDTDGGFYTTDQSAVGISSSAFAPSNLRPLLVLDLNGTCDEPHAAGRTEAQRLVSMLRETADEFFTPDAADLARKVADQIETQIPTPRIEEPLERWSRVFDGEGREWCRTEWDSGLDKPWQHDGTHAHWRALSKHHGPVTLSPGVPS